MPVVLVLPATSFFHIEVLTMWRISNLRADNDASYPAYEMRLNADFVTLYNPTSGLDDHTEMNVSNLGCAINSFGAGSRDQSAAFVAGDVVEFYFIWGTTVGINTICSKRLPTLGPVLPTGYTSYAPAFPVPMIDSATLLPLMQGQGYSHIQVRGNIVNYPNPPVVDGGTGYPAMAFDLSKWIPPQALLSHFLVDAEAHSYATGPTIGGVVMSTALGNFLNQSLYPQASWWASSDVDVWTVLGADRHMTATFMTTGGFIDNAVCVVFVNGYSFG